MPKDIIVVGASAGGIEALRGLVGALPEDFAASVFVVLHTSPESPGLLAGISEKMDDALWNSIRAFEEGELFMRHMAEHLGEGHNAPSAQSFLERAEEAKRRAGLLRQAAVNGDAPSTSDSSVS